MLAATTGIPVFKLTEEESQRLLTMEGELHRRVIGQEHFMLQGTRGASAAESLGAFLAQFYETATAVPPQTLLLGLALRPTAGV